MTRFEDAYPQFLEQYIKEASESSNTDSPSESPQIEGEIASAPEIRTLLKRSKKNKNSDESVSSNKNSELIDEKQSSVMNLEVWLKKSGKSKIQTPEAKKAVLPEILALLDNVSNKSIHQALNKAGFIRSGSEFITREDNKS